MSRSLWITLLVLVAALWLVTHRHAQPIRATNASGGGGSVLCALPERFHDPNQPLQTDDDGRMPPFRLDNATVTPLAGFSLQARVLSREDYSLGAEAKYSPTDLALGWGPMADPAVADRLGISQGGRWYRYQWGSEGPPIAPDQIVRSSANMHMIPADRDVADALAKVRQGDIVHLDGWLVQIDRDDGWHWRSSTTREDSGDGACEVVYVCSIGK
jgi:hypothetical protein